MVRFKAHLVGGAVAWLWLLILAAGPASAAPFDIELIGGAPAPVAGGFQWNYSVTLGGGERIQVEANIPTLSLPSNRPDFFIIYDFAGYVPGSIVGPAGWTATVQDFTPVASRPDLQGGVFDDPGITNLVFTRSSGAPTAGPITLTGFSAVSAFGAIVIGIGSAEFTNNDPGGPLNNTNNVGSVAVAVPVPEPSVALLLLAGPLFVFGAVKRGLRRRQA